MKCAVIYVSEDYLMEYLAGVYFGQRLSQRLENMWRYRGLLLTNSLSNSRPEHRTGEMI